MAVPLDREYLRRRHAQSLAMADNAADPAIARVHRSFAAHYEQVLAAIPREAPRGAEAG